jgi:hypothetical protein
MANEDLPPSVNLWAALAGFKAQYGDESVAVQHPDLPIGFVERIDSLAKAAERMLLAVHDL